MVKTRVLDLVNKLFSKTQEKTMLRDKEDFSKRIQWLIKDHNHQMLFQEVKKLIITIIVPLISYQRVFIKACLIQVTQMQLSLGCQMSIKNNVKSVNKISIFSRENIIAENVVQLFAILAVNLETMFKDIKIRKFVFAQRVTSKIWNLKRYCKRLKRTCL